MFLFQIETDGAAFADGNAGNEIARMMRLCADVVADRPVASHIVGTVADVNGNTCGAFRYIPEPEPEPEPDARTVARCPFCARVPRRQSYLGTVDGFDCYTCERCGEDYEHKTRGKQ